MGILEEAGFWCHETDSGDQALELLGRHAESATLLFSDVDMLGGTSGFALARRVDREWPHIDIDIVIASGRVKPEPGDMPDKATFIGKPFSAQMVRNHLAEQLSDGKKPDR